jgi:hypothetical protein
MHRQSAARASAECDAEISANRREARNANIPPIGGEPAERPVVKSVRTTQPPMKTNVTTQPAKKTGKQSPKEEAPKLLNDHQPSNEEIAMFAYFIWENNGRPEGHELEDWLAAEQELKSAHSQESVAA